MADNKLLELIGVLNKQSKKDRVTDADKEELDPIIRRLDDSQVPDYRIAANIADAAKLAIKVTGDVSYASICHTYPNLVKVGMDGALQCSTQAVNNAKEIDTKIVSNSNKYLLKKIIEKAIVNIAKSKEYVMGIQIGEEHKDTIDKIKSKLKAAEDILKGKVKELNKQFTDERSQKEKISESATQVYNSYLLLYKLNELHVDKLKANGERKSLQEVISEAIDSGKQEVSITINEENYKVEITPEGKLKIKVLNQHTKPEVPGVKDVLDYTDEEIIDLWANSEVSIEKDQSNNFAFAVGLHDKFRLLDLKVGGLGKKVPFSLRFANFYKVIKILKDESKPLKERFRLANNIATGSGKTGDIALLKFWAYLANIPCITMVPSDTLRNQSNKFDEEFLPGEVAMEFGEPFSEGNTRFATTTFDEAFNTQWDLLKRIYGENSEEPALFLTDEARKLKENVVLLARAIAIARNNPIAFFSATPDKFLNALFGIILQILLSPKERAALGIGKLPVVFCEVIRPLFLREAAGPNNESKNNYISPAQKYILQNAKTYSIIDNSAKQNFKNLSSEKFLDILSRSIDSSVNKKGLVITNEAAFNNNYEDGLRRSFADSKLETHREECKKSYLNAIKELNTGLSDKDINKYIDENLEIPANYCESLKFIPLHGLIDIIKTFLTQDGDNLSIALSKIGKNDQEMKEKVGEFLQARYGIDNCDYDFKPKDKLTDIIFNIIQHIKRKSANTEYIHSVDRNYTADKKLNADIMQIDGVQGFCDDYRMISCFADSKNNIQHLGKGNFKNDTTGLYVEEPCVASTSIQNSERNIEILLNMFRAKLIGNFVANKKMGIGVDDVDLDKVICITEGPTDLLDPAYEFQVLGRGGRGNQKGTYFFYRCTDSVGYFEHSDITLLNGEDLRKKFEEARENYIQDEQANIERRTVAIFDKMCDALSHNDICFKYVQATHNGVISVNGAQNWYLQEVEKILIDEFKGVFYKLCQTEK